MVQGLRIVGAASAVANVVWFVAALAYRLVENLFVTGSDTGTVGVSGLAFAPVGFLLSIVLFGIGQHLMDERLWRSDLRRGTATVHDLRPGDTSSNGATQVLTCRLEIRVAGVDTISADYRADIGPLDAPRFVEGATFACEVSGALPERIRIWLLTDPNAGELTGRYRDFQLA